MSRDIVLRPYQERAVERVRELARQGARRILMTSPTGTGKTVMGLAPALSAIKKGGQVLWLAHRRELVSQAAQGLLRAGTTDIGVILSGAGRGNPHGAVQVASLQTLFARGQRPDARVVIWDEAHHCTAASYRAIAEAYPNAWHIGLTATPERSDHTSLGDVFEEMVVAITSPEAVRDGWLVPCHVRAPARLLDAGLAQSPVTAYMKYARGKQAVVFCSSVGNSDSTAANFRAAGFSAASIDGTTPLVERMATLRAFAAGRIQVLTNCQVLTEGWDCPSVEVCILARGCGSTALYMQMVGRVLRPAEGKQSALLIDLRGVVHQHGLPHDERIFGLDGLPIRLAGGLEPIHQCQSCGAVFRERACPLCGKERPPPVERKDAVRSVTLSDIYATEPASKKRETYFRFLEEAKSRGHRPGAAAHRFRAKYGHWPERSWAAGGGA